MHHSSYCRAFDYKKSQCSFKTVCIWLQNRIHIYPAVAKLAEDANHLRAHPTPVRLWGTRASSPPVGRRAGMFPAALHNSWLWTV